MKNKIHEICIGALLVLFMIFVVFFFFGCYPEPEPEDHTNCGPVEQHMIELECNELLEIPDSTETTWTEWCIWIQNSGIDTLPLVCMLNGQTCEEIEVCLDE